jgi:hypothetical protein
MEAAGKGVNGKRLSHHEVNNKSSPQMNPRHHSFDSNDVRDEGQMDRRMSLRSRAASVGSGLRSGGDMLQMLHMDPVSTIHPGHVEEKMDLMHEGITEGAGSDTDEDEDDVGDENDGEAVAWNGSTLRGGETNDDGLLRVVIDDKNGVGGKDQLKSIPEVRAVGNNKESAKARGSGGGNNSDEGEDIIDSGDEDTANDDDDDDGGSDRDDGNSSGARTEDTAASNMSIV